jgi:serine O-acetyltransferase
MTFFKLVAEDFRSTPNALLQQGFWALLFHRYGSSVRRIKIRILYIPLRIIHHILIKFSEVFFGIYIGPNAVIGRRFRISHFGAIIVHANAVIGDDVHIRQGVTIGNSGASKPNDVPTIGDRVDVGAGAKILGGIVIGNDVAIGANAVVIRDVPPGAIAVGVPAQIKFKNKSAATT